MSRFVLNKVPAALAVLLLIVVFVSGCKFGHPKFTVTVKWTTDNIKGFPEPGDTKHKELSEVVFRYEYTDGTEGEPPVYLNDSALKWPVTDKRGVVTVYTDTILYVGVPDIRTKWDMVFTDKEGDPNYWTITFTGTDRKTGTFSISNGKTGTWSYNSDNKLEMEFDNWEGYKFTASAGHRYIDGEWKAPNGDTGNWKALFINN